MFLTYSYNMLSGVLFYALASLWFVKRRFKFVDQKGFLKAGVEKWGASKI